MRNVNVILLAFVVFLAACGHEGTAVAPAPSPAALASLPPPLYQDCVGFTTLDDACTRAWYGCRPGAADPGVCVKAWEDCCTLRGQGARSRFASAAPVVR